MFLRIRNERHLKDKTLEMECNGSQKCDWENPRDLCCIAQEFVILF